MKTTELIFIGIFILLLLSITNYNFKIIFTLILGYLIFFPEKKQYFYNTINNTINNTRKENEIDILFKEGNENIAKLHQYNKKIYKRIKINWKKFKKTTLIILDNSTLTYQHQHYSILKDLHNELLNDMSSLIVSLKPESIQELTSTIDRTLPLDVHIRSIIRKMDFILNNILKIIASKINERWDTYTSTEINPIDIDSPEPVMS